MAIIIDPIPEGGIATPGSETGDGVYYNRQAIYFFSINDTTLESGNVSIDNLIFGSHRKDSSGDSYGVKWGDSLGGAVSMTYSFATALSMYNYEDEGSSFHAPFLPAQKTAAITAMTAYANVSLLSFSEVTDSSLPSNAGDIRWGNTTNPDVGTAFGNFPDAIDDDQHDIAQAGDMWFGPNDPSYKTPTPGTYGGATFIHELGHALGLNHPHHSALEPIEKEDQLKYSIMSYKSYEGDDMSLGYSNDYYPTTLMLNDIRAIQFLYGINWDYNRGDTIYSWKPTDRIFQTIWDGGGNDTISAVGQTQGSLINLNSGEWSEMGVSFYNGEADVRDGLTIAYGAEIENAIGSAFDDDLVGNSLNNTLTGGDGNDTLDGRDGNDTLAGGYGNDILVGGAGQDVMTGGYGDDALEGGEGDDTMTGGHGKDSLDGGVGADTMIGGSGGDTYVVDDGGDTIKEVNEIYGLDTVQASITYTLGDYLEDLLLVSGSGDINGTGNALNNTITGNEGINILSGGLGNDTLYGGGGDDSLLGGAGNDTLDGEGGDDVMTGGLGDDVYWVDSLSDVVTENADEGIDLVNADLVYYSLVGTQIENLTLLGGNPAAGRGNDFDNIITGNGGVNILTGDAGDDTLDGGAGTDTLDGGAGADSMLGGLDDDTYMVDDVGDVVTELKDAGDYDEVRSTISYALGANLEELTLLGTDDIDGAGNELDNTIVGSDGINMLSGGLGNDIYEVQTIGDTVVEAANAGIDEVRSSITFILGANVEDLILMDDAGDIDGTGNALDNWIVGNNGVNELTGLAGNDNLYGGAGADQMIGGAGDDTYWVDDSSDTVMETDGMGLDLVNAYATFVIGDHIENLSLYGYGDIDGTGNGMDNKIIGNVGDNTLTGGGGNDWIYGGMGTNKLIGGTGDDTYLVDSANDTVIENAGEGTDTVYASTTYTLSADVENLVLTGSFNPINGTGNDLANKITGNEADNVIDGGLGNDDMAGGRGNDVYLLDNINDKVTEVANAGTDEIRIAASYTLGANVENLTLLGGGNVNGTGNALNNVLTGNSGVNTLTGGAGNDVYVIDATDTVVELANGGIDEIRIAATYTLAATLENLTLQDGGNFNGTGNALSNVLRGNAGDNGLDAGAGNDTLYGGAGTNTLTGGIGNDIYLVDDLGSNTITEGSSEGTDLVMSSASSHTLSANVENLTLTGTSNINGTGNALNNAIIGNAGNNALAGGGGADTINGGLGNDTLDGGNGAADGAADKLGGGAGNDTYIVDLKAASTKVALEDTVTEGKDAGNDTIELRTALPGASVYTTLTLGANIENMDASLTGTTRLNLTGNALANILTGNAADNVLDGKAGEDSYVGGAGNDTYVLDLWEELGNITELAGGGGADLVKIVFKNVATEAEIIMLDGNLSEVENVTITGTGLFDVTGNDRANVLTGNASVNGLYGGDDDDTLSGLAGNDLLEGGGGNDTLNGGAGNDVMTGGAGNDVYFVDALGDVVTEYLGEGTDTVNSLLNKYVLHGYVENLILGGSIAEGSGNDLGNTLTGNAAANKLYGMDGDDTLLGLAGNDTLDGGLGNDTLDGGVGKDIFLFSTALDELTNVDQVVSFVVADDTIWLENAIFTSLGVTGVLAAGAFNSGAGMMTGAQADDRIVLNTTTGDLYYDADGNGAGAAVKFATLVGIVGTVTNADFFVV